MFDIRRFNNMLATWGAAAASRVYVDALSRLARQAQLGTWGGSKDVGNICFANHFAQFKDFVIAVRLIVVFFGAVAQNRGLKFYDSGVDAADRVNAL
ncbi:hypothetical protein ALC57_10604 [Trachymyrmex cornetzi]|uniref:Uncharacterized protein n=1 Tax=Trachymyrmex cornetzi TaxID=471704 RepID=A0A151J3V7_9HYME|nr:hypothetical protein ALC57_10604 [Trachymyrmex cornetzi]